MENPFKMDDFGGTIIFGNTQLCQFTRENVSFPLVKNLIFRGSDPKKST